MTFDRYLARASAIHRLDPRVKVVVTLVFILYVALLPAGAEILCHKNNSDGKGNSYGCHENYLMDRNVPFGRIVAHVMPHFISRQVYTG